MNKQLLFLMFLKTVDFSQDEWIKTAWQWSVPVAVIGLCALLSAVYGIARVNRKSRLCRVPLAGESEIEISQLGEFNLCLEIPTYKGKKITNLDYKLTGKQDSRQIVELNSVFIMMRSKNAYPMTIPVRSFQIGKTGKYQLTVTGLGSQPDYYQCFLVVARPIQFKMFLCVMAILFSGLLFIGGFVLSIISFEASK